MFKFDIKSEIPALAFILFAFPLYSIWKLWLAYGVWSLSPSYGYIISLPLVVLLGFFVLFRYFSDRKIPIGHRYFYIFIAIALIQIFVGKFSLGNITDNAGRNVFLFNLKIIGMYLGYFWLGLNFPRCDDKKWLLFGAMTLLAINICYFADYSFFNMPIAVKGMERYRGEYPHWGNSLALIGLWLIASFKKIPLKSLVLLIIVPPLYFIGSRTSFFLFIIAVPLVLVVENRRWIFWGGGLLVLFGIIFYFFRDQLSFNRTFNFFSISKDRSAEIRLELFMEGIKLIFSDIKTFLLGEYAGQVLKHGDLGHYIHSYFSLWRQFGIYGFLLFLYVGIVSLIRGGRILFSKSPVNRYELIMLITCTFFFVSDLGARGYISPYPWLAFGIIVGPWEKLLNGKA